MKRISYLVGVIFCCFTCSLYAKEKAPIEQLPTEGFSMRLEFNSGQEEEGSPFDVFLQASHSQEKQIIEVLHSAMLTFHHESGQFSSNYPLANQDVTALIEAAQAVKNGTNYEKTLPSETTIRTVEGNIVASRDQKAATFTAADIQKLQLSLKEAEKATHYYSALLNGKPLPKDSKLPKSSHGSLNYTLGEIAGTEFRIQLIKTISFQKEKNEPLLIIFHLDKHAGKKNGLGVLIAVEETFHKDLIQAGEAAKNKEQFQLDGELISMNIPYKLSSIPESQQVNMLFQYTRQKPEKKVTISSNFSQEELDKIPAMLQEAEKREAWFAEHKSWFVAKKTP